MKPCSVMRAAARGVPHSPFLDPLVLDLLYVFEQRGYPPIPRYEVEATIETFLRQPNRQLRGTALEATLWFCSGGTQLRR